MHCQENFDGKIKICTRLIMLPTCVVSQQLKKHVHMVLMNNTTLFSRHCYSEPFSKLCNCDWIYEKGSYTYMQTINI